MWKSVSSNKKKLNIVIFGYGKHGQRIKNIASKINGKDYILNFFGICRSFKKDVDIDIFQSIEDLKNKVSKIDCVFISTPDNSHFKIFKECVRYEIPFIYVEKPAYKVEKFCKRNTKFLKERIKYIQIGYHFNYESGFKELSKIVRKNEMGELLRLEIFSGQGLAFKNSFKESWRAKNKDQILKTVMSHLINYVINLDYGFQIQENKSYLKQSNKNGFFDTSHISGLFSNGAIYSLTATWGSPLKNIVKAYFSNGFWTYDYETGEISTEKPRDVFDDNGYFVKPNSKSKKVEVDGLKNSIEYFLKKCANNKFSDYEFNNSELTSITLSNYDFTN